VRTKVGAKSRAQGESVLVFSAHGAKGGHRRLCRAFDDDRDGFARLALSESLHASPRELGFVMPRNVGTLKRLGSGVGSRVQIDTIGAPSGSSARFADSANVEELFRRAKKGGISAWGPSFQRADGVLRFHTFATVIGLMLVSLAKIALGLDLSV